MLELLTIVEQQNGVASSCKEKIMKLKLETNGKYNNLPLNTKFCTEENFGDGKIW